MKDSPLTASNQRVLVDLPEASQALRLKLLGKGRHITCPYLKADENGANADQSMCLKALLVAGFEKVFNKVAKSGKKW